jgi:putative transposase
MYYNYKYRLNPSEATIKKFQYHIDTCRQLYNHVLYRLNETDEIPAQNKVLGTLPDLKSWWNALNDVYAKTLHNVVNRVYNNLSRLKSKKEKGYSVGMLNWRPPREYRSFTYKQSGFKLKNTSGRTVLGIEVKDLRDHPVLWLSKIGEIPIKLHREIPEDGTIKQVTVKQEPTGEWFATLSIKMDIEPPEPPENPENCVGIDVGILKYCHDTEGTVVSSLDLSDERERLEREQQKLSRKQYGSNNYEKQRLRVAECHADLRRKRRDFLHKLSNYYAREYDLVAVEDLNVEKMKKSYRNSRNTASAAWSTFTRMLEYKCKREGTHFTAVEPAGTTEECANCGNKVEKELSVRKHSCPTCGFEADRDANAAWNILSRGVKQLGVGHSESTPVETALPTDTHHVSAKCVIEAGSPHPQKAADHVTRRMG